MLSGQVLSSENHGYFLVLNGHKWGTLTWPLTLHAEDAHGLCQLSLSVDNTLGADWMFITNPSDFVAWPYEVIWSPESGIRLQTTSSNGEALIKNSIRKPQAFVFADLCRMGAYLGIERSDRLPREQLLRTIADIVSEGDEDFISMVIGSDKKKKRSLSSERSEFVELVLNEMGDEIQEFDELQKEIKESKKDAKKTQWQEWYDEKRQEVKEPLITLIEYGILLPAFLPFAND